MRLGWLIGAALFMVAALAMWVSFRSPEFVMAMGAIAIGAAWKAVLPSIARRMPPDEEAAWRAAERRGQGDEWLRKRWKRRGRDR